jgi:hypothetical protein
MPSNTSAAALNFSLIAHEGLGKEGGRGFRRGEVK